MLSLFWEYSKIFCSSALQVGEQNANVKRWNEVCQNLHASTFPGWASGIWEWREDGTASGVRNISALTVGTGLMGA